MNGVPKDLDLSVFQGARLDRVDLGEFIVYYRFGDPKAEIGVEGDWELLGPDGAVLDHNMDPRERAYYRLHLLLGKNVVASELNPPESFALRFDSGHLLRIYDRSAQYESFSIQPGNVYV